MTYGFCKRCRRWKYIYTNIDLCPQCFEMKKRGKKHLARKTMIETKRIANLQEAKRCFGAGLFSEVDCVDCQFYGHCCLSAAKRKKSVNSGICRWCTERTTLNDEGLCEYCANYCGHSYNDTVKSSPSKGAITDNRLSLTALGIKDLFGDT